MANLPLGFGAAAAGAVLIVAGIQNKTPAQVILGQPSTAPPLSTAGVSSPTAAGVTTPAAGTTIPGTTSTLGQPQGAQAAQKALSFLGEPYKYGGLSQLGIDCSGLVVEAYQGIVDLPHNAAQQWLQVKSSGTVGTLADAEQKAGELIFLEPSTAGPQHVAISLGNGFAVEAPHTGTDVKTIKISDLVNSDILVGVGSPLPNQ